MNTRLLHNIKIIKAIIFSGNRVAYTVLLYRILSLIIKPIDILIATLGGLSASSNNRPMMVFVTGSHRSGATFISQVVSRQLPFYSIGNFNSLFTKSGYIFHKLFKPNLFKCRGEVYQNYYGQTSGLLEINDAHEVWDQWYGKDHSIVPEVMTLNDKNKMFSYFSKLYNAVQAPIISKSGRNSLNIVELNSVFTNGFFIVVDRDLEDIVISTLKAGNVFKGKDGGWGLKVNDAIANEHKKNKISNTVIQCIAIKNKINQQLREIDNKSYIVINYKTFCNDTDNQLRLIVNAIEAKNGVRYKVKACNYPKFKAFSHHDKNLVEDVRKAIKKYSYMIEG